MTYNSYDLQNTSLVKTGILTEMYVPLWFYSSGHVSNNQVNAGSGFICKGNTSLLYTNTAPAAKLHTLNSNWSSSQKFAFEASTFLLSSNSYPGYAELWDMTTNTAVSGSQISTTTLSTPSLIRSGQFTLIPGHTYGITLWSGDGSVYSCLTKASLIAFLS